MSFFLCREPVLRRIPLVRYSARTKRENRVKVQLLKDFAQYGAKGEVIDVLPGLMRNKLHPNNGACYIIPELNMGPKIPVVKREVRLQQQRAQQTHVEQQAAHKERQNAVVDMLKKNKEVKAAVEPVAIDGLLFDLPEDAVVTGDVVASKGYSMITLELGLDTLRFSIVDGPVSKTDIVKRIQDSVGFAVPEKDVQVSFKGEDVESLSRAGEYQLVIKQEGSESVVTKKVLVKKD